MDVLFFLPGLWLSAGLLCVLVCFLALVSGVLGFVNSDLFVTVCETCFSEAYCTCVWFPKPRAKPEKNYPERACFKKRGTQFVSSPEGNQWETTQSLFSPFQTLFWRSAC